jgi:hypothetical protein
MVCGYSPHPELAKRHMLQGEAESRKPKARQATSYKREAINQAQTFFVLHTFLFSVNSHTAYHTSYFLLLFLTSYFFLNHAHAARERQGMAPELSVLSPVFYSK